MKDEHSISLDFQSGVPIYKQIIMQVEMAMADGRLSPGSQLPTVRALAADLQINPNTVVRAYSEMEIRGLLNTQQGSGTFISNKKVEFTPEEKQKLIKELIQTFSSKANSYGISLEEIVSQLQITIHKRRTESDPISQ